MVVSAARLPVRVDGLLACPPLGNPGRHPRSAPTLAHPARPRCRPFNSGHRAPRPPAPPARTLAAMRTPGRSMGANASSLPASRPADGGDDSNGRCARPCRGHHAAVGAVSGLLVPGGVRRPRTFRASGGLGCTGAGHGGAHRGQPAGQCGFVVQLRRWVVEPTFGWVMPHHRLAHGL